MAMFALSRVEGATISVELTDPPVVEPTQPLALCRHSIVAQVGNGFMAAITITNISDQYISDWFVEWDYGLPVTFDNMLNGILTGTSPFRAESPEPGRAISPGAMTTIYLFGTSPMGIINNPRVQGNFCS